MKVMAILISVAALVSGADAADTESSSNAATMAVADSSRPESDTTWDADHKPAQTLAFAGVKSWDRVADYVADSGYFTRLFVDIVGSAGTVTHPNVTVTTSAALEGLKFPEKLDLAGISRNYHDLHDKFMDSVDTAAFNKAIYSALKPEKTCGTQTRQVAPCEP